MREEAEKSVEAMRKQSEEPGKALSAKREKQYGSVKKRSVHETFHVKN